MQRRIPFHRRFAVGVIWAACSLAFTCFRIPTASGEAPETMAKKAGETTNDNGLKMSLVWCPPGEFKMGKVRLSNGFWLGKTELTQTQWKAIMGTTPWKGKPYMKAGDDYPATYVSWDDAIAFCKKLTAQERKAGRLPKDREYTLPTEAQWESACRAGTTTQFSFGDGPRWTDHARFDRYYGEGGIQHYPAGKLKPNPWGLLDMHGNVCEWCRDSYIRTPPEGRDPEVTTETGLRVIRGGSAADYFGYGKSGYHGIGIKPDKASPMRGFRVALVKTR